MRKLVVSQRVDIFHSRNEIRYSIDQDLMYFLQDAGFQVYQVPNDLVNFDEWINVINPDGVILSGGNDLGENLNRDRTEHKLISYAIGNQLSLLGICRGMQMLVTYFGGKLESVSNHVNTNHELIVSESFIGHFPDFVNSFHDYGFTNCPPVFDLIAISHDGIIEAVKHKTYDFEGWMWHPERDLEFNDLLIRRVKELF